MGAASSPVVVTAAMTAVARDRLVATSSRRLTKPDHLPRTVPSAADVRMLAMPAIASTISESASALASSSSRCCRRILAASRRTTASWPAKITTATTARDASSHSSTPT
jgi:hypothetical protein